MKFLQGIMRVITHGLLHLIGYEDEIRKVKTE